MSRNAAAAGIDTSPAVRSVHCYVVRDASGGPTLFLTNYDQPISIGGMPAKWAAADPQEFTPGAIIHGALEKRGGIDEVGFEVKVRLADAEAMSRYLTFGMIPRVEIGIIKVQPGAAVESAEATWDEDTQLVNSGLITDLTVQGRELQADCVPEPLLSTHQVPRWRFTRTCNHQLYGEQCGVVAGDFDFGNTILAIDPSDRKVTISGQRASTEAKHWRQGVLIHPDGIRMTILNAEHIGGNTVLQLHQWSTDLEVSDNVTIRAGCDHTAPTCEEKFSNLANFGGFPQIPNSNPNIHGIPG